MRQVVVLPRWLWWSFREHKQDMPQWHKHYYQTYANRDDVAQPHQQGVMNHSIKYSSLRKSGITMSVRRFAFRTRTKGAPHMRVPARYVWQAMYVNLRINHPDWLPGFDERTRQRKEMYLAWREALKRYVATKLTPEARVCSVCKKDIIEECECCSPRFEWIEDGRAYVIAYVHDPTPDPNGPTPDPNG